MNTIIERYKNVLLQNIHASGWYAILEIKALPGDETNDIHLLWMLEELILNETQSLTKKHRWLGYVQGVMVAHGYLNVTEERDLTRDIFNGD